MRPRGPGTIRGDGYIQTSICNVSFFVHVLIAEKVLGKPLPIGADVHHADGNRANNANSNLVICPNRKYHMLLHMRMRAVAAGVPAHFRMCEICRKFDEPSNLYIKPNGNNPRHRECWNKTRPSRRSISRV